MSKSNSRTPALSVVDNDAEMGAQLTAEFELATDGMRHVIRFGAMMMMLRAHLISTLEISRGGKLPRGTNSDGGIKKWIEENAPKVKLSTAYRFEDVAKAVAQSYVLPAKVAKALSFEQLVTAKADEIDPGAQRAQTDLFDYVAGTSQKSWLDRFRVEKERGGARTPAKRLNKSALEIAQEEAQIFYFPLQEKLFEVLHEPKAKQRLLYLEITSAPEEASLTALLEETNGFVALLKEAIAAKRKAVRR